MMTCANNAQDSPPLFGKSRQQQQPEAPTTLSKENTGWRKMVRNFTPPWFSVNMGTGIVSILLHNLPYNGPWLQYVSYVFFGLNVLLFVVFLVVSVLRYLLYPEIWGVMIAHPAQSLFLGCFPMALATIINMMILSCQSWGHGLIYLAWTLWWIDVLLSMATCIPMPFIVMHRHRPGLQNTTASLLLPIVPTVVAAASGGIVADALPNANHAYTTIVVSYVLWGIGQALSACVIALYFHRLTIYSLPRREVIVSVFLPVGPFGQGGFGIQQLGKASLRILPQTAMFRAAAAAAAAGLDPARAAEILYVLGVFFGLVWMAYALMSLGTTKKFPFNMGWWGFTFPIGVWATCADSLAVNLGSDFFKAVATISSIAVLLLWIMVSFRTFHMVITGDMFLAPCLNDLRKREQSSDNGSDKAV